MTEIAVVGGCYHEFVRYPSTYRMLGSGMRAGSVLSSLGHRATLHTLADDGSEAEVRGAAASLDLQVELAPRPTDICFTYTTPLSVPSCSIQLGAVHPAVEVTADAVVAFGMVEGPWRVRATQLVVDPQHSPLELCGLNASSHERLALVLNEREATTVSGSKDPTRWQNSLLKTTNAEVVVVKRGIRGAMVISRSGISEIGAYPTAAVHPVGSGDAFTAGFAAAWFGGKSDPVAAARQGSRVAACCCFTGSPQIERSVLDELPAETKMALPAIYLAGPFFTMAECWLVDQARDGLADLGVDVFSPFHDVGLGGDEVAARDLAGLRESDGVLALLDGSDAGTLFEIGWAREHGLPVVAFASHPDAPEWTMLRGTDCEIVNDLSTAVYRAGWAALAGMAGRG